MIDDKPDWYEWLWDFNDPTVQIPQFIGVSMCIHYSIPWTQSVGIVYGIPFRADLGYSMNPQLEANYHRDMPLSGRSFNSHQPANHWLREDGYPTPGHLTDNQQKTHGWSWKSKFLMDTEINLARKLPRCHETKTMHWEGSLMNNSLTGWCHLILNLGDM